LDVRGPTSKGRGGNGKGLEGEGKERRGGISSDNFFYLKAFCTGFGVGYLPPTLLPECILVE